MSRAYGILQAKWLIHTVGPVFGNENAREPELLASCYRQCLALAIKRGCRSIAFPSISTGAFDYPVGTASCVALQTIRDFLDGNQGWLDLVEMVTFSHHDDRTYVGACDQIFGSVDG